MAERMEGRHDGSGAALIAFLNDAMQRGLLPPQVGANYIVACKDILPFVLGESWACADVSTLDMAKLMSRVIATKGDRQLSRFNEQFLPAVEAFRKHLGVAASRERMIPTEPIPDPEIGQKTDGEVSKHKSAPARRRQVRTAVPPPITTPTEPSAGSPPRAGRNGDVKRTSRRTGPGRIEPAPSEQSPSTPDKSEVLIVNSSPVLPSFGVIPHLFPLRDGVLATLLLPADLTMREARRLTAFIESLALSDSPAHSAGAAYPATNGSVTMPETREEPVHSEPTDIGR
jgi:hypothetical protein